MAAKTKKGTGPVWMHNLRCTGTEDNLQQCFDDDWGRSSCKHERDVYIECDPQT